MNLYPNHFLNRRGVVVAGLSLALVAITGCSATLNHSAIPIDCPDAPLVSTVFIDVTGSSFSSQMKQDYEDAISHVATRTASCSGSMSVSTFGESSGQTVTLLQQSFQVEAPTENALRRKQQKLATDAVAEVRSKLDDAAANTPASATDVVGLLRLVEETSAQRPDDAHEVFVLTDGFTNVGFDPTTAGSVEAAAALAEQVSVPDLTGVELTFSGIGRTTTPVPSAVIEQVTAFWKRVCERTQASSCTVATQWQE